MKKLFVSFLLFASCLAVANVEQVNCNQISVPNLSAKENLALIDKCEQALSQKSNDISANNGNENYAEIAKEIGKGLGTAAREIGMAATTFANSDAGRLIVWIMFWKYLGISLYGSLVIALVAGISIFVFYTAGRRAIIHSVEYEVKPVFFGLFNRRYVVNVINRNDSKDVMDNVMMASFVTVLFTIVIIALII